MTPTTLSSSPGTVRRSVMFSCQRCEKSEAQYRVKTELLTIFVCAACADKARKMGFPVNDASVDVTAFNSRS